MMPMPKVKTIVGQVLIDEALRKIQVAKAQLLMNKQGCFFGILAMKLVEKASMVFPTMATNGVDLYYNPIWVNGLTGKYALAVVAHEVMHCALHHFARTMGRDARLYNQACDYVINLILKDAGFAMPPACLLDGRFRNMSSEEVYRILEKEQQESEDGNEGKGNAEGEGDGDGSGSGEGKDDADGDADGDGDGDAEGDGKDDADGDAEGDAEGDGSGSGDADGDAEGDAEGDGSGDADGDAEGDAEGDGSGSGSGSGDADGDAEGDGGDAGDNYQHDGWNSDPGQMGGILPAPPELDADEVEADWTAAMSQAAIAARQQGTLPGSLTKLIADILNPELPWTTVLADFVQHTSRNDYDWRRTSKRYLPQGIIMPSIRSPEISLVVAVDNSYSLNVPELTQFLAELTQVLETYPTTAAVLYCDTRINRIEGYTSQDLPIEPKITRGGGTDFRPMFEYVENEGLTPDCLIYFTDLEGPFPDVEPDYPVLWVSVNKHKAAPWGHTLYLTM